MLLNILGFAPDILQVTEKWVTCPCDLQTFSTLPGHSNLQSLDRTGRNVYTWTETRASSQPHTLHCSFISFTHPSIHSSKIYSLMPTLNHDPCSGWDCRQEELLKWHMWKPEQRQTRGCGGRNLRLGVRPT